MIVAVVINCRSFLYKPDQPVCAGAIVGICAMGMSLVFQPE